jgi:hypothetical protein
VGYVSGHIDQLLFAHCIHFLGLPWNVPQTAEISLPVLQARALRSGVSWTSGGYEEIPSLPLPVAGGC